MGNVLFNTEIDKTVDINKLVNLDVTKDVFADVDIQGRLATAEASADAIGGGGGDGGGGGTTTETFLIDNFADDQIVTAVGSSGTDTLTIDIFGTDLDVVVPVVPAGLPPWDVERTFTATNQAGDLLNSTLQSGAASSDKGAYSVQASTNGLGEVVWAVDIDGDGAAGEPNVTDDAYDLLMGADPFLSTLDFIDVTNDLAGTLVDFTITDSSGDSLVGSVELGAITGNAAGGSIDIKIPFSDLLGLTTPSSPIIPGTEGLATIGASSAPSDIDLASVVLLELDIIGGQPETDTSLDLIQMTKVFDTPPGAGNLAETDTFAQVTDAGAFSFSEALAASSGDVDLNILG